MAVGLLTTTTIRPIMNNFMKYIMIYHVYFMRKKRLMSSIFCNTGESSDGKPPIFWLIFSINSSSW